MMDNLSTARKSGNLLIRCEIAEVAYELDPWEVILPELIPIHGRLENWAACAKYRRRPGTCYSMEGRYRAPSRGEAAEPKQNYDPRDAMAINRAMVGMPLESRLLLHGFYLRNWEQWRASKTLAIPFADCVDRLNAARHMVGNRAGQRLAKASP